MWQVCCGLPPSAPHRGHVPIVVRRLIVGETRADIRIRIRGIVIRIRIRYTAIRVRVVVTAIDHTAYWMALPGAKLLNICTKHVRILHNAPKQHGDEATEHRASPVYPVPWAAVQFVFEFQTRGCDNGSIDSRPWRQGAQTDKKTTDEMLVAVAFLQK